TIDAGKLHDLLASVRGISAAFRAMDGLDGRAMFSVEYFCLRMLAYAARRAGSAGDVREALRVAVAEVFPDGIDGVLAQARRRGWWLRNRRMVRGLRRAGAVS